MNLESWGKPINRSDMTLEHVFPEDTCAECGRKFMRRCRRSEWGYYYNGSPTQHSTALILFCSGECSKKYAEKRLREDALKLTKTKTYKVWKLMRDGMTAKQAARTVGITSADSSLATMQLNHWKELEWLEQHGGEVAP